jgi:hypothetical protein
VSQPAAVAALIEQVLLSGIDHRLKPVGSRASPPYR